jgi:hypothetical protein
MNIFLWVLQIFLAIHTVIGAVWKFSNSEQTVPSLKALPHEIWMAMLVLELICGVGLVLPALMKRLTILVPISAGYIALEMILFTILNLGSDQRNSGEIVYWLVVAALCGLIAYGRLVLKPVNPAQVK